MKQTLRLTAIICILSLLAGCGLSDAVLRRYGNAGLLSPDTREQAVLETQRPLYTDGDPAVTWGRSQLTERAQAAYDLMCAAIAAYREEPLTVDADSDEIQLILTAIRIDHPEYFWFDGHTTYVSSTLAGVRLRTECTFDYTMARDEIQTAHQSIARYTAACLSALDRSGAESDYDKILGVYRYIIDNTDYVLSETDQSILSVMDRHAATCAGYARSFQYLMSRLGIPCTLAMGEVADRETHGWNMVQCDGQWYQMDVTWGDPVDAGGAPGDNMQYTYCLVTDEDIYKDHTLICDLPMPRCTATQDNYFVREGLQFEVWDPDSYEAVLTAAAARGDTFCSVRFSGGDAYAQAVSDLFQREMIWDILRNAGALDEQDTRVNYSQKDLHREITVRLGGEAP